MRSRQTKADLTLARRIRAASAPIYIEEDDGKTPQIPSGDLRIRQFGGVIESRAFDYCGFAGYILNVVITFNVPQFAISAFELELPYKGLVWWLQDPMECDDCWTVYRFPSEGALQFERDYVLNHLADVRRTYSKGQSVKGMLLGVGTEPISDEFPHGSMIPGFLIVTDQFGHEYRFPVSLWADRANKIRRSKAPRASRRGGLLDRPDRKPVPSQGKEEG